MHVPTRTALAAALALALGAHFNDAAAASAVAAAKPSPDAIDAARATPGAIILRAGIIDPASQRMDVRAIGAAAPSALSDYAIVQFNAGSLVEQRKALQARGVTFLGYVPNRAYYVRLGRETLDALGRDPSVRWA
ncbi:MAG TPA: hypothetical protein VFV97_04485, partial [Rhodanobacteraceae bacterium]|nr:hypothetical protein [Rhodanobacteraceae bacterium]